MAYVKVKFILSLSLIFDLQRTATFPLKYNRHAYEKKNVSMSSQIRNHSLTPEMYLENLSTKGLIAKVFGTLLACVYFLFTVKASPAWIKQ